MLNLRHSIGIALGVALVTSGSAMAADPLSYTFAEIDLVKRDVDLFDDDQDAIEDFDDGGGAAFQGGYAFTDTFFMFGGFSSTESDITFSSDETAEQLISSDKMRRLEIGVGMNGGLGDNADFVGRLGYTDIDFGDFDIGGDDDNNIDDLGDDSSDGFMVDFGIRGQMMRSLEGSFGVRYLDIEDRDNTSLFGTLLFEMSDNWGINLDLDVGDEITTFGLGVRFIGNN